METNKYFLLICTFVIALSCTKTTDEGDIKDLSVPQLPQTNRVLASEIPVDHFPKTDSENQVSEQRFTTGPAALPEMAILYDYLEMNTKQVARFETYYHFYVTRNTKEDMRIIDQMEMQHILDDIFETILSKEQFVKYNEWKE